MTTTSSEATVQYVMVLQDGETYSGLDGCTIIAVPAGWDGDDIGEYLDRAVSEQPEINFTEAEHAVMANGPGQLEKRILALHQDFTARAAV